MNAETTAVWRGRISSVEQMLTLAGAVASLLRSGDVIALLGPLGAGKTQFVRGVAAGLGLHDAQVSSPTFVLAHEYEPPAGQPGPVLVHIDAYRLSSLEDLESMGWDLYAAASPQAPGGRGQILAVEWAQRIGVESLGPNTLVVEIEHAGPHDRLLRVSAREGWRGRLAELVTQLNRVLSRMEETS